MFSCSFNLSGSYINFGAMVVNHTDKAGALRELTCDCHFGSEGDWNTFRAFLNWNLEVVPMPWGNTVEVLVKGGPGSGTLTIPGLNPSVNTAWVTEATRTWLNPATGHSTGKAVFLIDAT